MKTSSMLAPLLIGVIMLFMALAFSVGTYGKTQVGVKDYMKATVAQRQQVYTLRTHDYIYGVDLKFIATHGGYTLYLWNFEDGKYNDDTLVLSAIRTNRSYYIDSVEDKIVYLRLTE